MLKIRNFRNFLSTSSGCSRFYILVFSCCYSCFKMFTIFSILHNFTLIFSHFSNLSSLSRLLSLWRLLKFLDLQTFKLCSRFYVSLFQSHTYKLEAFSVLFLLLFFSTTWLKMTSRFEAKVKLSKCNWLNVIDCLFDHAIIPSYSVKCNKKSYTSFKLGSISTILAFNNMLSEILTLCWFWVKQFCLLSFE